MTDDLEPRRKRTKASPMPVAGTIAGAEREALSLWWKERIQDLERLYEERIEILRTVGEHPSPVFAKIVRRDGVLGIPKDLTAKTLGISVGMLTQFYGDEYDIGATEILRMVASNGIRMATSLTDPAAAKMVTYVLDRRGGQEWKPPSQKIDIKNEDVPPVIDSSKLTYEERQALRIMLTRVANGGEGDPVDEDDQSLIGEGPA